MTKNVLRIALAALAVFAAGPLAGACAAPPPSAAAPESATDPAAAATSETSAASETAATPETAAAPPTTAAPEAPMTDQPRVQLQTSHGTIVLALDPARAPKTVASFLGYVRDGFYDGTVFHRVIPGFMIQGGGFTSDLRQKPTGPPVENEADNGLQNRRGTIAMARTGDPHSATAQFFVNLVDNRPLDHTDKSRAGWGYTVFGEVVEGMDVVDRIAAVATGNAGGHQNVPRQAVVIERATVVAGDDAGTAAP
jgi:peptidyl-prolyl cis-trans isomerase B (cyclophilin B)